VEYHYTDACGRSATSSDSMSLPAVNGSVFTLTGAGPYAEYVHLNALYILHMQHSTK